MAATSGTISGGSSTSTSGPQVVNTPQSDWEFQLAQMLGQIGQGQYQWAQDQFANTSAVTDQSINQYLSQAAQGGQLAGDTLASYENTYQPLMQQYAQQANDYASNARIQHNMGAAESDAAQAGTAGRNNAEQQLQSFGIDPSSGRYQDLIAATNTAQAASAAAAGEQARVQTQNTGRQMQENAIQQGEQLPGAAVNAMNSAYQGIAGAENSSLANANTGVNLLNSADAYMNSAMSMKYPQVGQASTSTSRQGSTAASMGAGGGGGGNQNPGGGGGSRGGSQGGNSSNNQGGPGSPESVSQDTIDAWQQAHPFTGPEASGANDPNNNGGYGGFDTSGFGSDMSQSYGATDPSSYDESGFSGYGDTSDYGSFDASQGYSGGDYGDYASGGSIEQQTGGVIPSSMSPSGGQNVDDVSATIPQTGGQAKLNVDEFVIPRDVALWKGQEFFQKLIMQSRAARTGAPAKPSAKPPGGTNA